MRICLASTSDKNFIKDIDKTPFILESFYYIQEWQTKLIKNCKFFVLDSGAFTFMQNAHKGNINWQAYIDSYVDFINRNDVKYFFELDIDSIVGYEKVKEIRKYIEKKTGKKCIPVWHKSRGKEEFIKMCEEYDYVAIGGIVSKEIRPDEYKFFTWFIDEAHKRGCKIHGLGFTSLDGLLKYKFDSVDSTSWKSGGRFGQLHIFKNNTITSIKPKNCRAKDYKKIDLNNYRQWLKFVLYAEKNL